MAKKKKKKNSLTGGVDDGGEDSGIPPELLDAFYATMANQNSGGTASTSPSSMEDYKSALINDNPFDFYGSQLSQSGLNVGDTSTAFGQYLAGPGWGRVQQDYKTHVQQNPFDQTGFQGFLGVGYNPNAAANLAAQQRNRFLSLTPHQRGINSPFSQKPTRWAVY